MFDPDHFLTDGLAVFAQSWVEEFRGHWRLDEATPPTEWDPEEWETVKLFDRISEKIVTATKTLDKSEADWGEILGRFKADSGVDVAENKLFNQCLETHLVGDLEDELDHMRKRVLKLIDFLMTVEFERARAYLARVGACYIRGLDTETVVMCGAVLDTALQELFDDNDLKSAGIRCGRFCSLGNRIQFAKTQVKLFDESAAERAYALADDRNNAIHTHPEASRSSEVCMAELGFLLDLIEGYRSRNDE